jgi:membrane protease YdiL (CAAX protease family)
MNNSASISKLSVADALVEQHSLGQLIVLHLLPGGIATAVYIVTVPLFTKLGYPSIMALYLPMTLSALILELGYLFYRGYRMNGTYSLKGIVQYREPAPGWMYVVFPVVIVIWGILITALVSPLDNLLLNQGFKWLPDWYAFRNLLQIKTMYPRETLLVAGGCALILNGLVGPIVEELYFRGHLLPRMARFGHWAPLLHVALFSLYHGWTPWMFISRVAVLVPMVYGVWWKRNIYMGMITHCLLNLISVTVLFAQLLG